MDCIFSVIDFGARPNEGRDDTNAIRKTLAEAKRIPGSTVIIPAGTYTITTQESRQLQERALSGEMSHQEMMDLFSRNQTYSRGLDFSGAQDLTINAGGAELMVDGWMEPLSLRYCEDVTINGLTLDHKRPPFTIARISRVSPDSIEVRVDEITYPVPSPKVLSCLMVYDNETQSIVSPRIGAESTALGGGNYRVKGHLLNAAHRQIGEICMFYHCFHFRPGILIQEAKNIALNDVTIHSQPGMGIVGHLSENITLNKLRVMPRKGRYVSTNTDATHFASCRGHLHFNDCEFGGQGDDSTNVHNYYHQILRKLDANTAVTGVRHADCHSMYLDYPQVGDRLAVCSRSTLEETAYATVTGVDRDEANWSTTIRLDGNIPDDIENHLLANTSALPSLEFINCKIRSHRARSVLVKTRKVLIEGCIVENITGTAVHIGTEGNWNEGMASEDVIVRNNRFINNTVHAQDGAIFEASAIAVNVHADNTTRPGLHKRLLFEGNEIVGGKRGIFVSGAEDVTIRGNSFRSCEETVYVQYTNRLAHDNSCDIEIGRGVQFADAKLPRLFRQ